MKKKVVELRIPEDVFERMEQHEFLSQEVAAGTGENAFGGLNRALSWLVKCDCAILSGWRGGNTRKVNDENNRTIWQTLHGFGYGVCKCRGCYPEAGKSVSTENSFFVFDPTHSGSPFFERIKELSERFDQDCFLYKEAGEKKAYLFGTNEDFGMGRRALAGELHLRSLPAENFTRIGSGSITFR